MKWEYGEFEVDTDPHRIDYERVYEYLKTTYWANDRSFDEVRRSWEASQIVFGVYARHVGSLQIGTARVLTDFVSFAWLADVFVDSIYRGNGVGKFLVGCVVEHPDVQNPRQFMLGTRDAHGLYERFGWEVPNHNRLMIRPRPGAPSPGACCAAESS